MTAKVQPNPTMAETYDWEQGKFFAGPFWLWGDDLIFDKGAEGTRNYLKEGDADSEGIIEVNLVHAYDRVTVEVFPAKMDEQGELMLEDGKPVVDGDRLYHATHDHPDKVRAGIHRFWDGRVNRIKGGEQAVPNHQPSDPVLPPPPRVVTPDGKQYVVVRVYEDEDEDKVDLRRADDDGKKDPQIFTTALASIEKVPANQNVIGNWQAQCDAITENHAWTEQGMARAAAHPYFLDPDFGYCLVKVTGEYTEDGVKVPITGDLMTIRAYAKKYFLYVERDQQFSTEDNAPWQLSSDAVAYQWAGFLQPEKIKQEGKMRPVDNPHGGELLASRHTALANEHLTRYPNTPIALEGQEDWRFYDAYKRLTQRGELVIITHGNTLYMRLEDRGYNGFRLQEEAIPAFTGNTYPLPQLNLNTTEIGLFSCFSGTQINGDSSALQLLGILDEGLNGLEKQNSVVAFDGLCSAAFAKYYIRYNPPVGINAGTNYKLIHDRFSSIIDGWNLIISSSGVSPALPVHFQPYSGVANENLTELWTMIVVEKFGNSFAETFQPPSVKPGDNLKADPQGIDSWWTFPYPAENETQSAEIWEIAEAPVGTAKGTKKADFTYSGINVNGLTGIQGIDQLIQPDEGKRLVIRIPNRGGDAFFARYALQKYKIEQNQLPDENGIPGGDRMKELKSMHDSIQIFTVPEMVANDIANIAFFVSPIQHNTEENLENRIRITSP